MLAYTYVKRGKFELLDKPVPQLIDSQDAIVRVTLGSICTSDLHIKHGSVPRAVPGITVGHEMVGVVEQVGADVTSVRPGDRVTVNVETFCGECFFCRHGYVNNCTLPDGGWALGCRIDGGQAEYVRVPYANQGFYTTESILKMAEYGCYPSFMVTASDNHSLTDTPLEDYFSLNFENWYPQIEKIYNRLNEVLSMVEGQYIVEHKAIGVGVYRVTYSGGT